MGLDESVECHPELGNIKQALEGLVQQRLEFDRKLIGVFHMLYSNIVMQIHGDV